MRSISLDTAAAISGVSRRTLWRRIADGHMVRAGDDKRGRALVDLAQILKLTSLTWDEDDLNLIVEADLGDVRAIAELGALLFSRGDHESGTRWLEMGARAGDSDAMQWLAVAYASGKGVSQSNELSIRWLAEAAAAGHQIAAAQFKGRF